LYFFPFLGGTKTMKSSGDLHWYWLIFGLCGSVHWCFCMPLHAHCFFVLWRLLIFNLVLLLDWKHFFANSIPIKLFLNLFAANKSAKNLAAAAVNRV
jgi:hypothetical protein